MICQASMIWWNCLPVAVHRLADTSLGNHIKQLLGSSDGCTSSSMWQHRLGLGDGPALLLMLFALPRFLVTCVSVTKSPSQALLAALDVGVLLEMNKCFARSLPLSHAGIREVSRLVSHLGLLFFCHFLALQENKIQIISSTAPSASTLMQRFSNWENLSFCVRTDWLNGH